MNELMLKPFLQLTHSLDERLAHRDQQGTSQEALQGTSRATPQGTREGLVIDLAELVQRLVSDLIKQHRALPAGTADELRYAMAAWCDELLLAHWRSQTGSTDASVSLEQHLFHTIEAGEKIFWNIDRTLSRRSEGDLLLAPVYLAMLALGYRGQYSDAETPQRLRSQLKDLCEVCVIDQGADAGATRPSVLLGQAQAHSNPRKFPLVPMMLVLSGAIFVSSLLYADWHWQRHFGDDSPSRATPPTSGTDTAQELE